MYVVLICNHLSLYKQGPKWPRVTISLSHFPSKNVTSCYSANKKRSVFVYPLFLRFFILRIPRHLLFLSFCVYCRRFPMLTLHFRFEFSGYTAISHSCCMHVAWFRVSFLSREKKTWKTMAWCCCSMLAVTTGSFSCLLCCSCSCLSHHWLPPTVAAYTHNPTLCKFSFPSPSSAFFYM